MKKKKEKERNIDDKGIGLNEKVGREAYLLGKASEIISETMKILLNQNLHKKDRVFMINIITGALKKQKKIIRRSDISLNKGGLIWQTKKRKKRKEI